jgi:hypothetical protein
MLVKLGNAGIKNINDLADLASDELKEILDGIDAYWGTYGVGDYNQIGRTFMSTRVSVSMLALRTGTHNGRAKP